MNKLILLLLAVPQLFAMAQAADYVREKKWADEIVPGVVVGDPVYLKQADGHEFLTLYTPAAGAKRAVIVVHGIGVHPDWGLIGVLRSDLVDRGMTTLSVQMPVLANEAKSKDYLPELPEARERLKQSAAFLSAKGYTRIAIVSHSLGSVMVYSYLAARPETRIDKWVSLGMSPAENLRGLNLAVLDLYGEKDLPEVLKNAPRRAASLKGKTGSRQQVMPGADHFFTGMERDMVNAVSGFLNETKGK